MMNRRRALMGAQSRGNTWWKNGTVVLASNGSLTVQHNFGTQDVAIIVWPSDDLTPDSNQRCWNFHFLSWINVMPSSFSLDCSSYNSKRTWPVTIERTDTNYCVGPINTFPTNALTSIYHQTWTNWSVPFRSAYSVSDNSIQHGSICKGTYKWVAVDLNKALANAPYAHGTITKSSNSTISIDHNLGTDAVAFFVFPVSDLTATAGYLRFIAGGMNLPGVFADVDIDISSYYTGSGATIQTASESNGEVVSVASNLTPWSTQANWYAANYGQTKRSTVSFASNSVSLTQSFVKGDYEWYAIDLSEIVTALGGGGV